MSGVKRYKVHMNKERPVSSRKEEKWIKREKASGS